MDAEHLGNLAAPVLPRTAGSTRALALAQQRNELATQLATRVGVDGVVDRLVRDVPGRIVRMHALECGCNLLWRPTPAQQGAYDRPQRTMTMQLGQGPGIAPPLDAGGLGAGAGIACGVSAVAPQLTAEGRGAAPHQLAHGPQVPALLTQRRQRHALFCLQLCVSCSHLCNLPDWWVLHFKLEVALQKLLELNNQ